MSRPRKAMSFDQKFGTDFIRSVPTCPGVYRVFNASNTLIYIGKAKNLRRRLGQYKNAKRRKKHAKMRAIVADAARIEFETRSSDFEACLLETHLIQEHRPKWNVAGAFYFLYPLIGIHFDAGITRFCYTTQPELFPSFRFHGAYRSRHLTKDAFFALMELLDYVGHRVRKPSRQSGEARHSYIVSYRQLSESWVQDWELFWKGESRQATENLVLSLVENAGARKSPTEIQAGLDLLKRFWRHEAAPLQKALTSTRWADYPVSQKQRDILFLRSKNEKLRKSARPSEALTLEPVKPPTSST